MYSQWYRDEGNQENIQKSNKSVSVAIQNQSEHDPLIRLPLKQCISKAPVRQKVSFGTMICRRWPTS